MAIEECKKVMQKPAVYAEIEPYYRAYPPEYVIADCYELSGDYEQAKASIKQAMAAASKADEKTKYYVSYGSRRTMREANTFLTNIGQKHGSAGFYIISR